MLVRFEVDVRVLAGEAGEVPDLPLADELAFPELAFELVRQVVEQFPRQAADDLDLVGGQACFLAQFAQHRRVQVLAIVDTALRHLPAVAFAVVDALADEGLAVRVDQHHADAGAVKRPVAAQIGVAHAARPSISFTAARKASTSACPLGSAFRSVVKPWMMPGNSR